MIFIRTDANETIATGHVMRCATIAHELIKLGDNVTFLVSDEISAKLVREMEFDCIVLNSDWQNPQNHAELADMKKLLAKVTEQNKEKPKLLVDSYMIKAEYTQGLADYAVIAVIDDLFEEEFKADIIINYTLYHTRFDYEGRYSGKAKLLLGGKYVPLRQQFSAQTIDRSNELCDVNKCETENKDKTKVLIICGGGDKYNAMGSILESFVNQLNPVNEQNIANSYGFDNQVSFEEFEFYVVAGMYNPNKPQLYEFAQMHDNIHICENVTNMAELMSGCDIAVSAASTVLYECCAMQLPTVFFCVADNQQYDKECFTKNDVMLYAGDIRLDKAECIKNIINSLNLLKNDCERRKSMIKEMSKLIDTKGAERLAYEIANF